MMQLEWNGKWREGRGCCFHPLFNGCFVACLCAQTCAHSLHCTLLFGCHVFFFGTFYVIILQRFDFFVYLVHTADFPAHSSIFSIWTPFFLDLQKLDVDSNEGGSCFRFREFKERRDGVSCSVIQMYFSKYNLFNEIFMFLFVWIFFCMQNWLCIVFIKKWWEHIHLALFQTHCSFRKWKKSIFVQSFALTEDVHFSGLAACRAFTHLL